MSAGYLAVDLGAESGRVVLGRFDGGRVSLEEVHRFPNTPVRLPNGLHWDVLRFLSEIKDGLAKAMRKEEIGGIGIDSWGVDFGLLDGEGALVSNPYHHRDARTEGIMEEAFGLVPKEKIYQITGIQFLPINTLYQLLAMRGSPLLEAAETMLLIPDLMNYWLTGEKACEYTNATTTQLLDLQEGGWAREGNDHSYEELAHLAEDAPSAGPLVDPDHPTFLSPGDMPARIRSFCEETGQDQPEEPASVARCVFESLALKYRYAIEQARSLTGRPVEMVNVVGGGSQNDLLCQLTADAAGLRVVAGPVEATAIGNMMVQAFAQGRVGSLEEIRAVVRDSFQASTYEPGGDPEEWSGLHERFSRLIEEARVLDIPEGG